MSRKAVQKECIYICWPRKNGELHAISTTNNVINWIKKFDSLLDTYARDFPLKTIGGATAANIQKAMWIYTMSRQQVTVRYWNVRFQSKKSSLMPGRDTGSWKRLQHHAHFKIILNPLGSNKYTISHNFSTPFILFFDNRPKSHVPGRTKQTSQTLECSPTCPRPTQTAQIIF